MAVSSRCPDRHPDSRGICRQHYRAGDLAAKSRAFRSFNWATYSCQASGLVKTSLDEGTGYWFSDGYGDYMRHFQRGMASVPDWAPANQDHLLGSTSVVRWIHYSETEIRYQTFDSSSGEVLRLRRPPLGVQAGRQSLRRVEQLKPSAEGYSLSPVATGGVVLRLRHERSGQIIIRLR
jgi:hypothetical protein